MLMLNCKSVCFCRAKNNQKFRLQGNVRGKGMCEIKNADPTQCYFHHLSG